MPGLLTHAIITVEKKKQKCLFLVCDASVVEPGVTSCEGHSTENKVVLFQTPRVNSGCLCIGYHQKQMVQSFHAEGWRRN